MVNTKAYVAIGGVCVALAFGLYLANVDNILNGWICISTFAVLVSVLRSPRATSQDTTTPPAILSKAPTGELAEAVDRFFHHAYECLPTYVPKLPSMLTSFGIVGGLLFALIPIINEKRLEGARASRMLDKKMWILYTIIALVCGIFLQDILERFLYNKANIGLNKQHIINTYWLPKYMSAFRNGLLNTV